MNFDFPEEKASVAPVAPDLGRRVADRLPTRAEREAARPAPGVPLQPFRHTFQAVKEAETATAPIPTPNFAGQTGPAPGQVGYQHKQQPPVQGNKPQSYPSQHLGRPSPLVQNVGNPEPGVASSSLQYRFQALMQQNITYVLLTGFDTLPNQLPSEPILLLYNPTALFPTSQVPLTESQMYNYIGRDRQIVSCLGLQQEGDPSYCQYSLSIGSKQQTINVFPAGFGLFPPAFETRLFNARYGHNGVVSVPTVDVLVPAIWWHRIHRYNWLKEEPTLQANCIQYLMRGIGQKTSCYFPQFQS